MALEQISPEQRYAAFRHKPFLSYWTARFLTTFATMIVSVAVGWQVYDLTRDPFDLGIVGIVQFLPSLLLVLVTGVVADRFGRRLIMTLSTVIEAACALVLLVLTLRGLTGPLPIFAVLVMFGIARAFYGPASSSLFANLVPQEDFANAIAWNSSAWQTATIVGPVAGGLLYGVSAEVAYATAAVLMLVAGVLVFTIPKPAQQTATDKPTLETLFAGFRYIWGEKVVLGAISLDLFAVLLSGASALLPVYARDILDLGPWGLGLLRSAPAVGALTMSVWLAHHAFERRVGSILFVTMGVFGLAILVFALSTSLILSLAALAVYGAMDAISVVIRHSLVQTRTPNDMLGRVMAINSLFTGTSGTLGEFRAGAMAAMFGAVTSVVIGGFGALAVAGLWMLLFPQLVRVDSIAPKDKPDR